ncbi:MAG: pirin family protein [Candidatus Electryonea clarkiae]|nr:pirin family protein [Candidatus Electryonea clarkiae]MDP8286397.1 pirin family protein [Candidatus Electryonea clarkiae]
MNLQKRKVASIIAPEMASDGAGVKLQRSIASRQLDSLDPFLLLDHFGSSNPDDYIAGFPMHPHRGIETVTYMLSGAVNHKDSLGNSGSIEGGDAQWMTAGGGIMHEEMPILQDGMMSGFQLWVNLPAKLKMTKPRYQEVSSKQIPEVIRENGVKVRVIAGEFDGISGPVKEIFIHPTYFDVQLPPNLDIEIQTEREHTVFVYVFEGDGEFGITETGNGNEISSPNLVIFEKGDSVNVKSGNEGTRFLFISGKPLNEPVARYGPFVMNTQEEIQQALIDLRNGSFVDNS